MPVSTAMCTGSGLRPRTLSPGVRRFLKKTGVLYAACTVLYLPVTLYAGNFPVKNVLGELVRDAVLDGTFYHPVSYTHLDVYKRQM